MEQEARRKEEIAKHGPRLCSGLRAMVHAWTLAVDTEDGVRQESDHGPGDSVPLRRRGLRHGRGHKRHALNIYPLVARKIKENPGLIGTAWATLNHWQALGVLPKDRVKEWRAILRKARMSRQGRKELIAILSNRSQKNRRLLDFAPFAGILTREERRTVFLKCPYDH